MHITQLNRGDKTNEKESETWTRSTQGASGIAGHRGSRRRLFGQLSWSQDSAWIKIFITDSTKHVNWLNFNS